MSYLRQLDILVELIDLCQDIIADLRQKLSFYRASVYKIENHDQVRAAIGELALVLDILQDKDLSQLWTNFQASLSQLPEEGSFLPPPGESHISFQLGLFLCGIDQALSDYFQQITAKTDEAAGWEQMVDLIRCNRQVLLSLCKKNNRPYQCFESL